jgi:hypothetical protein
VEYVARADMSQPLTEEEKESGIHGVYISQTKSSTASFTMPVRFICRFTETSFIMAEDSLAMDWKTSVSSLASLETRAVPGGMAAL